MDLKINNKGKKFLVKRQLFVLLILTSGGRLVAQLLSLLSGYSLIEISNDITMYLSLISIGMLLLKKETLQDRLFKTTVKDISNKNILIKNHI